VSLLEGGVARHKQRLVSDRGGLVMARVPIPSIDEPVWRWTLHVAPEGGAGAATNDLLPREEVPGKPTLEARWDTPGGGVLPGDRVSFSIRLKDATGQPRIDHPVRWWVGPKGAAPPRTDAQWKSVGTTTKTDGAGRITGARDAPTLVRSKGTSLQLVAESVVE